MPPSALSLVIAAIAGMVRDMEPEATRMKAAAVRLCTALISRTGWCAR